MAVEAVVTVVIQKLKDMRTDEESTIFKSEIDEVLNGIELDWMRCCVIDAGKKQDLYLIEDWVKNYLRTVYRAEDFIETLLLWSARRRRSKGFFQKRLRDLRVHKTLRDRVYCIRRDILELNEGKVARYARLNSIGSASTHSDGGQRHCQRRISVPEEGEEEAHAVVRKGGVNGSGVQVTVNSGSDRVTSFNHALRAGRSSPLSICLEVGEVMPPRRLSKQISSYYVGESNMVGFKEYEDRLVDELTSRSESQRRVIWIVGDKGSGKTTLARTIFNRRDIKQHFRYRAWIFVSNDNRIKDTQQKLKDLLLSILKQVTKLKDHGVQSEIPELAKKLSDCLKTERYLLVMDDVRTASDWEGLAAALPDTGLGNRVMFTARKEKAASLSDQRSVHRLRPLSKLDSWDLFMKKVGLEANSLSPDSDIYRLKEKIFKICGGSPLATVLLGGLLSTKFIFDDEWSRILDEWSRVLDEWSRILDVKNSRSLDVIMSLCYDDLSCPLKLCLLYLSLFPKEFEIPVRRLFRLWLAEGFVNRSPGISPEDQSPGDQNPEEQTEKYFNDLVYRNMIQLSKLRSDGTPKKCRMPGVVYDQLRFKAQDIHLFHVHPDSAKAEPQPTFSNRRIVVVDIKGYHSCGSPEHLRSFLSFNTQNKDTPAKEVGDFLGRIIRKGFGLLRVLDLEGVYKPSLPDNLGNLLHLRYLGLRWTFLDALPQSVGDLPYLETLDVKHTYINRIPKSIWNSKRLRHLNLNDIRLDMPVQRNGSVILLTLWGLFVDEKSPVKDGLNRLTDLRELGITCQLNCTEELTSWIAGLTALQSLRLRSKDEMSRPSELSWKPLSSLEQLSHLYLLGHLRKLPEMCEFPPSLKVLTLSASQFWEDPMPTLGQLPSLSVLRLFASSYLGTKMVCHPGGFANLRVLKLWMLTNLEEWDVEKGAMQRLEKLEIRGCKKLKQLPPRLLQLSSLEDLILTDMPVTFATDVPESISVTDNRKWAFTPLPKKDYLQPKREQEDPNGQANPPPSCEQPASLCNSFGLPGAGRCCNLCP